MNATRGIDQDLELDVLGLQSLSSPTGLLDAQMAGLGGKTCVVTLLGCCKTCTNRSLCHDTVLS